MTFDKQLSKTNIKEQISLILETPTFKKSKILSKFLHFIAHETIEGREQFLKEYVIATKVLKRKSDFNPQLNSIVRIHAQRLRERLSDYYKTEGVNDSIIISIPKGRYIPVFEANNKSNITQQEIATIAPETTATKPLVAVLPFTKFQDNERLSIMCSVMRQDLSAELSKYNGINVISNYSISIASEKLNNLDDFLSVHNVTYSISGSCIIENNVLKITIELNYRLNNQIVWAQSFFMNDFEDDNIYSFRPIVQKILATICGNFGLIYRNELKAQQPSDYDHLFAVYCHNRYHLKFSEEAFHEAMEAITISLKNNPQNSLLTAFYGEIYLNLLIMDVVGDTNYLKLGTEMAKKSVELDDNNQHGYRVLAWANILNHDKKAFLHSANKCLQINPNNAMDEGAVGFGHVCVGKYKKGFELMSNSISLNPYYELSVTAGFVLYYIHENILELALDWSDKINRRAFVWDTLLRVTVRGLLHKTEVSEELKEELLTVSPNFTQRARKIVSTFIFDKELQNKILEGLTLAGIEIQD